MSGENDVQASDGKYQKNLVYLFKAPKEGEEDKFVTVLEDGGYKVRSIQVLSFNFINIDKLSCCLERLTQYSALVLTSTRGVEAVSLALEKCESSCDMSNINCYVVGKTTAEAAKCRDIMAIKRKLSVFYEDPVKTSKLGLNFKGEESGNAEELVKILVSDIKKSSLPVLYPCSNIRRDTITQSLQHSDIKLEEIVVYETVKNEKLDDIVKEAIKNQGHPEFMVYFSPSGVKYTQSVFHTQLLSSDSSKVIAIGPTTEKELHNQNFTIYGVAEKPEPQALLDIIQKPAS